MRCDDRCNAQATLLHFKTGGSSRQGWVGDGWRGRRKGKENAKRNSLPSPILVLYQPQFALLCIQHGLSSIYYFRIHLPLKFSLHFPFWLHDLICFQTDLKPTPITGRIERLQFSRRFSGHEILRKLVLWETRMREGLMFEWFETDWATCKSRTSFALAVGQPSDSRVEMKELTLS